MSNWFEQAGMGTKECYCSNLEGARKSKHCDCSSGKCVPRSKSLSTVSNMAEDKEFKHIPNHDGVEVFDGEVFLDKSIKDKLSPKALETYSALVLVNNHYIYTTSLRNIAKTQDKTYTGSLKSHFEELKKAGLIEYKIDSTGILVKHLKKISIADKKPKQDEVETKPSVSQLPKASQKIYEMVMASENKELITSNRKLAEKTGCSSLQDIANGITALVNAGFINAIKTSQGTIISKIDNKKS